MRQIVLNTGSNSYICDDIVLVIVLISTIIKYNHIHNYLIGKVLRVILIYCESCK